MRNECLSFITVAGNRDYDQDGDSVIKVYRHPMRKLLISTGAFQGHQGNGQGAFSQSPLLPP